MHKEKDKAVANLLKHGWIKDGVQHNGILFAKLDSEDILYRKVVNTYGHVRDYIPRKAKEIEKQRFRLSKHS